jgi:hypothetical protein
MTRHGQPAVRPVPVDSLASISDRMALIASVRLSQSRKAAVGPSPTRSQDFLHGGDGLPE